MLLGGFHAVLFFERLSSGQLLDPIALTRWIVGLVLVGVLLALKRSGVPLLWGRRALVFWTFVLFLHWSARAPAAPIGGFDVPVDSTLVLVVLPAACSAAGLALGLLALLEATRRGRVVAAAGAWSATPEHASAVPDDGAAHQLWARPPPLL